MRLDILAVSDHSEDRHAGRHRLGQHQPERLVTRKKSVRVDRAINRPDIVERTEKMNPIRDLQMRRVELYTVAIGRPADADVRDELASVCEKLGRSEEAARWRRNAAQTRLAVESQEARP